MEKAAGDAGSAGKEPTFVRQSVMEKAMENARNLETFDYFPKSQTGSPWRRACRNHYIGHLRTEVKRKMNATPSRGPIPDAHHTQHHSTYVTMEMENGTRTVIRHEDPVPGRQQHATANTIAILLLCCNGNGKWKTAAWRRPSPAAE